MDILSHQERHFVQIFCVLCCSHGVFWQRNYWNVCMVVSACQVDPQVAAASSIGGMYTMWALVYNQQMRQWQWDSMSTLTITVATHLPMRLVSMHQCSMAIHLAWWSIDERTMMRQPYRHAMSQAWPDMACSAINQAGTYMYSQPACAHSHNPVMCVDNWTVQPFHYLLCKRSLLTGASRIISSGRCSCRDATSWEIQRDLGWNKGDLQGKTWMQQDTLYCIE